MPSMNSINNSINNSITNSIINSIDCMTSRTFVNCSRCSGHQHRELV